ncbi:MAG: cold shock domain-containing protein [Deltaproteobacteria bacterium]|nr:cold shock domain-containing protein [Deltaproteobacteria bacterium]
MRIEGTLAKWNDDRGFGFIAPTPGGSEIFVHISVFPRDGHRPTIGERLTFEIETDSAGKKRAKNLRCPGRPTVRSVRQSVSRRHTEKPSLLGRVIPLVVVVSLAFYGYSEFSRRVTPQTAVSAQSIDSPITSFRCDGRTHCSQMTSCAEATFFLRNCPNVQMDGNHDGVPCEQQWCD